MNYEKAHLTQISRPTLELSLYKDPNRLFKKFQELKNIKLSSVPGRTTPKRNTTLNAKNTQKFTLLAEITKTPRHKFNQSNLNTSLSTSVNNNSVTNTNNTHSNNSNSNATAKTTTYYHEKKFSLKSSTPRKSTDANSKTRIYTSYLEHKPTNPFESNLNILTKSNPSFYMGLAKENGLLESSINSRFVNGNNSYINLTDYSLDSRILNKLLVSQSAGNDPTANVNSDIQNKIKSGVDTANNSSAKFSNNLFINFRKNDEKNVLKKPILEKSNSTLPFAKAKSISGRSNKKTRSNSGIIKKSVLPENNKLLKEFSAIKSPNQSFVSNNPANTNTINSNNNNNSNKKKEVFGEVTCRLYTDEAKYLYIKAWLDEVERVQTIEGKYLETINKISFYDYNLNMFCC